MPTGMSDAQTIKSLRHLAHNPDVDPTHGGRPTPQTACPEGKLLPWQRSGLQERARCLSALVSIGNTCWVSGQLPSGQMPGWRSEPTRGWRVLVTEGSDEDLLAAIGSDPAALSAFYLRHIAKVTGMGVRRFDQPEDVADFVANVFLEVLRSAARFDPGRGHAVAWLYGLGSNVAAVMYRQQARALRAEQQLQGHALLDPDDYARGGGTYRRGRRPPPYLYRDATTDTPGSPGARAGSGGWAECGRGGSGLVHQPCGSPRPIDTRAKAAPDRAVG